MILAIVGSTSLTGHPEAERIIEEVLDKYQPSTVVSGGAEGIDTMAERAAERRGIQTLIYRPEVKNWSAAGGFRDRNHKIAQACDRLVRIAAFEATTYGSGWTQDRARAMGKPVEEYVVKIGAGR